jgi:hypothetical protein
MMVLQLKADVWLLHHHLTNHVYQRPAACWVLMLPKFVDLVVVVNYVLPLSLPHQLFDQQVGC